MDTLFGWPEPWAIALVFAAAMSGSWALGRWRGRHLPDELRDDPGAKFTDASVALLGLLLAFTFAMAMGRHDQRRLTVVAESNAIGDFYTCASLLKEPQRARLQEVIRNYARDQRAVLREPLPELEEQKLAKRTLAQFTQMTDLVREALEGTPIAMPLTNTLNNVTSSYASRLAAYQE